VAVDYFSADYATARARFIAAAGSLGWRHSSYPIEAQGPKGERLSIDVAISSATAGNAALVVSSGLHGVEGFFGSAVQLAALATMGARLAASGVRIVFIHALNPYGFSWSRRVNEDNIDLNRNFLLSGDQFAGSPDGYARLDSLLNPPTPPQWQDTIALLPVIVREGMPALKQAVAGGQYDFPKGLFFGGHAPSQTVRILADHLSQWIGACDRVLHLDLHTGLGRWARYQLIADSLVASDWWADVHPTLSGHRIVLPDSSDNAYRIHGGFGQWMAAHFADREYRAHHWSVADHPATTKAKRRLRELFCPSAPGWRKQSLSQALALLDTSHRVFATV
jgi:Protein of unknown function (DUF2817)